MRTTLDIDNALMDALVRRVPGRSKTKAIEYAIECFLAVDAYEGLRAMAGKVEFDERAHRDMRAADRARQARLGL